MLWTAFTLGLLGSLHCVGMCGPIVLALPGSKTQKIPVDMLIYHLGRISTYFLLGAIIGLLGLGVVVMKLQAYFSILMGVFLLAAAIFWIFPIPQPRVVMPWANRVNQKFAQLMRRNTPGVYYQLGMLNGLLPCGLVYLAIAGAALSGGIFKGGVYMALFGLGTLPLLLLTGFAGQFININVRSRIRKLYPVVLTGIAILFLMRGFNLEIPAEFRFWQMLQDAPMCH